MFQIRLPAIVKRLGEPEHEEREGNEEKSPNNDANNNKTHRPASTVLLLRGQSFKFKKKVTQLINHRQDD